MVEEVSAKDELSLKRLKIKVTFRQDFLGDSGEVESVPDPAFDGVTQVRNEVLNQLWQYTEVVRGL